MAYIGFRFLIGLFRLLPESLLFWLSDGCSFLLKKIIGYRKAVIERNLNNSFPQKTIAEKKQIAANYYQHLSDLLIETLRSYSLPKEQLESRFRYENTDLLLPYLEDGQSILLLGSHFGNWEMGCLSFPLQTDYPVYTVYKPLSNPKLETYLKKLRSKWGMQMVPMNQLARVLVSQKNTPSIYILVADQSPASTNKALWKTFLHQRTPFMNGIEKIAKQTGYPVFNFAIEKEKRGRYRVQFSNLWNGNTTIQDGVLSDVYIDSLTQQINKQPSEWLWSHNRWKRAT